MLPTTKECLQGPTTDYEQMSRAALIQLLQEHMDAAEIKDGPHKCPKGLRHGYGIKAVMDGVPLNMLKKWMGHAKLETTEIYTNAVGDQERDIAARMWR